MRIANFEYNIRESILNGIYQPWGNNCDENPYTESVAVIVYKVFLLCGKIY